MVAPIPWNGTEEEKQAMILALDHHCDCRRVQGELKSTCTAHTMLLHDPRAISGMIASRRRAAELMLQEFLLPPNTLN